MGVIYGKFWLIIKLLIGLLDGVLNNTEFSFYPDIGDEFPLLFLLYCGDESSFYYVENLISNFIIGKSNYTFCLIPWGANVYKINKYLPFLATNMISRQYNYQSYIKIIIVPYKNGSIYRLIISLSG